LGAMSLAIVIFWLVVIGIALAHGDFSGAAWSFMGMGLCLFVWQTICGIGRDVQKSIPRGDTYNLTQNRYDLSEDHPDPTRPRGRRLNPEPGEDFPAIIEVERKLRKKS
jgi:hypothetical protein